MATTLRFRPAGSRAGIRAGSLAAALLLLAPGRAAGAAPEDYVSQQLSFRAIRALEAWGYQDGSREVVVAILDSGIDASHPELVPNLFTNTGETPNGVDDDGNGFVDDLRGWDFVEGDADPDDLLGRGTHLAGIVGAVRGNGAGIAGLNREVSLLPVRVHDHRARRTEIDPAIGAAAIRYAADLGADVILVSFRTGRDDAALRDAVRHAVARGAVVVVAAGDRSRDLDRRPEYPAAWREPGVISVAAIDQGAKIALSSNYGRETVSMTAPGVNVFSTLPGALAGPMSGSPQAAAHVAGGVALFRAHRPELDAVQVAEDVPRLSSNRRLLEGTCRSASVLDLGLLIAEKRETVDARIDAPTRVRVGEHVVLDGTRSEGPIVEYLWKFGDPLDEFGPVVPRHWDRPGRVGVELIVRTFDGRTATAVHTITIEGNDELSRIGCAAGPGGSAASLPAGAAALLAGLAAALLRRGSRD